jgi:crotonobetainyl-CoA:carnitine CoA-transferase CaiB-like acyl-CoA transferase
MSGVLHGVRVLDFGRYVAGPFCAALLADMGADVIRIDRIGGGEDRFVMPVAADGQGALFLQSNRNKRSLTLDIDHPEGQVVVQRLVRSADVVVVNMPVQTLRKLSLDYESLTAIRPDIILTTVSAFGNRGPLSQRPAFDAIGQAMSGAVYLSGMPRQPARSMVQPVDFATAMCAAFGTMAALYERRISGKGQVVEASLLHTALTQASGPLIEEAATGIGRQASGNRSPISGPSDIFSVKDGWIIVSVVGQPIFERWVKLVGRPEMLTDARFRHDLARGENGEELSAVMSGWCQARTRSEALLELERARIPAGPVYSPRETLGDEHIQSSGFLTATDYPGLPRPTPVVATPVSLSRTPATIRSRAPMTGEHSDAILGEIGYDPVAIARLKESNVV